MQAIQYVFNRYFVSISLASIICAVFFIFGAAPELLYYNQEAIANGEVWRLISGHFVHSDLEHLVWNLCAFVILAILLEQQSRTLLFISLLSGTIAIDYYLWFNSIGVINYAGLSGVLNTLLVVVLFQQFQRNKNRYGLLCSLPVFIYFASLLKIIIELSLQQAIFTDISWQPLPQVHWIGFIIGTMIVLILALAKKLITHHPSLFHSSG